MFPKELTWPMPEPINPEEIAEQIKALIEKAKNAGYIVGIIGEYYGTSAIYLNSNDEVSVKVYQ